MSRGHHYKGVEIPPCPKVKVLVTRRKGRVGSAMLGGILLGPLGLTAGALTGNRSESEWKERNPTTSESAQWNLAWKREFEAARGNDYDVECRKRVGRIFKWIGIVFVGWMAFSWVMILIAKMLG